MHNSSVIRSFSNPNDGTGSPAWTQQNSDAKQQQQPEKLSGAVGGSNGGSMSGSGSSGSTTITSSKSRIDWPPYDQTHRRYLCLGNLIKMNEDRSYAIPFQCIPFPFSPDG